MENTSKVMNNEDLRREIWSYLRKEPKIKLSFDGCYNYKRKYDS